MNPLAMHTFLLLLMVCINSGMCMLSDDDFGQALMQFNLEHELVKGKFTKRATLSLRSYTSDHIVYREEAALTDEELDSLIKLAKAKDIYRARILFTIGNKAEYVYGFVYACDLLHSRLRDNVTLAFNSHGHLTGLHLAVADSSRATFEGCSLAPALQSAAALPKSFATHASASRPVPGPAPETQIYIARMEEEKKRKLESEQGDNRSFLAKYWMYIVPAVVVLMMMSNAADPNAQGGGGGGS